MLTSFFCLLGLDFQCIFLLLLLVRRLLWASKNFDSKSILSITSAVFEEIPSSKVCCLHFCRHLWICLFLYSDVPWIKCEHGLYHDSIFPKWCCNSEQYTQKFLLLCLIYHHQILVCDTWLQVQDDSVIRTPNVHYHLISKHFSLSWYIRLN